MGCDDSGSPSGEQGPEDAAVVPVLPDRGPTVEQDAEPPPPVPAAQVAIIEPGDGSWFIPGAVSVTGTWSGGPAGPPTILVNGQDAQIDGAQWFVSVELGAGPQTIEAVHAEARHSITLTGDDEPPRIDITFPERAAFTDAAATDLHFSVSDDHALDTIELDGRAVDSGCGLDCELDGVPLTPALNILQLRATDAAGNLAREAVAVLRGQFASPDKDIDSALRLHIGLGALAGLERFLVRFLDEQDLMALLPDRRFEWEFFNVEIGELNYARPSRVQIRPNPPCGCIDFELELRTITLAINLRIGDGDPYPIGVGAASLRASAQITPAVEQGQIAVRVANLAVEFGELSIALGRVPEFEDDPERGRTLIEEIITDVVSNLAGDLLPELVEGFLGDLDLSFDLDLLGAALSVSLVPQVIVVSENGLSARIGARVELLTPPAPPRELPGYLTTPTRWAGVPDTEQIGIAVDDDFVNVLLHQIWRSGVLLPTIDQEFLANTPQLTVLNNLLVNVLRSAYPDLRIGTPLRIETHLPLPIVARFVEHTDAAGIELGIGDLSLTTETDADPPRHLMDGALSLRLLATVALAIDPMGQLSLALAIREKVTAFDVTTESLRGRTEAALEGPMVELFGVVGELLPGLLSGLALPSFDLIRLSDLRTGLVPQDPNFLMLEATVAE